MLADTSPAPHPHPTLPPFFRYVVVVTHQDDNPFVAGPMLHDARAVLVAACKNATDVTAAALGRKYGEVFLALDDIVAGLGDGLRFACAKSAADPKVSVRVRACA